MPIFSTMGIQVCPLPTAVLSTHTTEFTDFRFVDLTASMPEFLTHWQDMGLKFDAVYSGFLGSASQVAVVEECIQTCLEPGGLAVVDPVMGDNGKLDPTITPELVKSMRQLVQHASCITPNLTEAALLLNEPYPFEAAKTGMSTSQMREWLKRLTDLGPETAIITSAPLGPDRNTLAVVAYQRIPGYFWKVVCDYLPAFYPGTGDTFTSVLTAALMQGDSLPMAMDRAVQFVSLAIRATFGYLEPTRYGLCLERVLPALNSPLVASSYAFLED
jgi:pyridoxine kinase